MIVVHQALMAHESGTKFYEVVSMWSNVTNRGSVIRRWGANGAKGDRKTEWFDNRVSMATSAVTVISSKSKRGYVKTDVPLGERIQHNFDESRLFEVFKGYFGSETAARGVCVAMRVSEDEHIDVPVALTPVRAMPEVVRGGDWASW